jgi:hypothetical protein
MLMLLQAQSQPLNSSCVFSFLLGLVLNILLKIVRIILYQYQSLLSRLLYILMLTSFQDGYSTPSIH